MSQKRQPEESSGSGEKRRKAGSAFRDLVKKAVRANEIQNLLGTLEPLLRRIVKEEVERALATHIISIKRQCGSQVHPSSSGSLQLQFQSTLRQPVYTGGKIEGEGCSLIVVLVDALTGYMVTSGPESSLVVDIVVLEGDFEGDKDDNWTFEEFKNNIIKEREGKRSLLAGDKTLTLREGAGVVNELTFTDNSSWTRSRKFRLGAKVENGHFNGIRIKEAKTEPFLVKDHRGELYKKHHPPSLDDEVWRLEKIGKDGAFHRRLYKEQVRTVRDFLLLLTIDAPRLRNILGSGMSTKMWDVTVEHARECVITKDTFVYYTDNQQISGVVYNVIGELKGLISEHQYIPNTNLSDSQKADATELLKVAYEHPEYACNYVVEDGSSPSLSPVPNGLSPQLDVYAEGTSSQRSDVYRCSTPSILALDMPSPFSLDCMRGLDDLSDSARTSSFFYHDSYKPFSPSFEDARDQLVGDDDFQYFTLDSCSQPNNLKSDSPSDIGIAVAEFIKPCGKVSDKKSKTTNSFDSDSSRRVTIGWGVLLSVLNWRFHIKKRIVATRRRRRA